MHIPPEVSQAVSTKPTVETDVSYRPAVESGVALPARNQWARKDKTAYSGRWPFDKMTAPKGDQYTSFFVRAQDEGTDVATLAMRLGVATRHYTKKYAPKTKFAVRSMGDGVRVFRIK